MAVKLNVPVSLPFSDQPIFLSLEDRLVLPSDFWEYATESINKIEEKTIWLPSTKPIAGVVRWLGVLPSFGGQQMFAGIETDSPVLGDNTFTSGCYNSFFPCHEGHSLFLPVEFVLKHSSKDINEIPGPLYLMKARPHGIALVIKNQDSTHSLPGRATTEFEYLFELLHYSVRYYSNITVSRMMQLMEEIASMDHTAYDSFVCCITSDDVSPDVYELVDKIDQCLSLLGKPKLFFINSVPTKATQPLQYRIAPDTFVMWSTQKGKISNSSLSTVVLNEVFMHRSMTADLISMTFEISALLSMFPTKCSGNRISIGQGIEVISQLSKAVYFIDYFDFLERPLESNVTVRWTSVSFSGPPGSCRSSIMKLLLDEPLSDDRSTSADMLSEVKTTSLMANDDNFWMKMDHGFLTVLAKKTADNLSVHWINLIDSGGQPAFIDIAPAILQYNQVNILTLNLDKKLEDKSVFYYNVKGKLFPEPDERQLTHLQHLEASFRSLASIDLPDMPHIMVLGIHSNEISEEDAILWSTLKQFEKFRLNYRESRRMVIFPLVSSSSNFKMTSLIRRKISKFYKEKEIPFRWVLFQQSLDQLQENSLIKIARKSECIRIGEALNMDPSEVEEALHFFINLGKFLYFPEVLPDIVFLHPQPLLDKLSKLISISIPEAVDHLEDNEIDLPPGAHEQLKNEGIFDLDLLTDYLFEGFSPEFSADHFLKLMVSLYIVAPLPQHGKFFIPSALSMTFHLDSLHQNFKYVDPLILSWNMEPIPQGLFLALSVNLLYRCSAPTFELSHYRYGESRYRNAIRLECNDLKAEILLVDSIYWLEIYYSGHSEGCLGIRNAIYEGIEGVTKRFNCEAFISPPQPCFYCTIHDTRQHLCYPVKNKDVVVCCEDGSSTFAINKHQMAWLTKDITEVLKEVPRQSDLLPLLADIAYDWERIGLSLKVGYSILGSLDQSKFTNIKRLSEVIQYWIDTQSTPVTWETVISAVEGPIVRKKKAADNIRKFLLQENQSQNTTDIKKHDISEVLKQKPTRFDLLNLLAPIDHNWYHIGLALNVREGILMSLAQSSFSNLTRLSHVVQSWIDTQSMPVTWETVIFAVESPIVNNMTVAANLRDYLTHLNPYDNVTDIEKPDISAVLEKRPMKKDLLRLLNPIKYQWIEIGELLNIPYGDLKTLQSFPSPDANKLSEMLQIWIDKQCSPVTWQTIIDIVGNPPVKNKALVDEIRHFLNKLDVNS